MGRLATIISCNVNNNMDPERKLIIELAEHAAFMRICESCKRSPGETVQRLPKEQREILKGLTSEHVDDIVPFWLRKKS